MSDSAACLEHRASGNALFAKGEYEAAAAAYSAALQTSHRHGTLPGRRGNMGGRCRDVHLDAEHKPQTLLPLLALMSFD